MGVSPALQCWHLIGPPGSVTLLSELLAPDLPLGSEAVYHRLLSRELGHEPRLVFLQHLELQAQTLAPARLSFQGMQTVLAEEQTRAVLMMNLHLSVLPDGEAAGPFRIHNVRKWSLSYTLLSVTSVATLLVIFQTQSHPEFCDGVFLSFDQLRDAALLFFHHRCELLHQRGWALLALLGLSEGRLELHQLRRHVITNLLHLQTKILRCQQETWAKQ